MALDLLHSHSKGLAEEPHAHSRFSSAKTDGAVYFRRRWHLDGLRGLSLDPSVLKIAAYRGEQDPPIGVETLILVNTREGAIVVGFARDPVVDQGLGPHRLVVLTRAVVESEPRRTTVASIWSSKNIPVDPSDRIRILQATGERGATLADLADQVRWPRIDGIHAVLSLVCECELVMDIDQRLRPESIARRWHWSRPDSPAALGP